MINLMNYPLVILVVSFLALWIVARMGAKRSQNLEQVHEDFDVIQGAVLTLLGLIVGFTFSMAVSRYDQRKLYEEEEANAIGTEYLRADLLSSPEAETVRTLLRQYLDQRIVFYQTRRNSDQLKQANIATAQLETRLWASVKNPPQAQQTPVMALVISGMNDVLNSQGYTQASWWNRIPVQAWVLLAAIALCGTFLVGLHLRRIRTNSLLLIVFPAIISLAFFLIADIDSPSGGLIRVAPVNLKALAESLGR
jgi:hypothetical protein